MASGAARLGRRCRRAKSTRSSRPSASAPFLGGTIKLIEGTGYEVEGAVGFNALATISYDPEGKTYAMHSYAQGRTADRPFLLLDDGFEWELAYQPCARPRRTAWTTHR